MAKNTNKTVETTGSVPAYVKAIKDPQRKADMEAIIGICSKHSGSDAKMWGTAIVGFGSYHYKYDSGREGDAPVVGVSSRAAAISLYIPNYPGREAVLEKFGKFKTGKGCIYVKRLSDVNEKVLATLVKDAVQYHKKNTK